MRVQPPLDGYTLRLLTQQNGRCPLCGDELLSAEQPPQSPVRAALPNVAIAVDHFHLVMLANKAVTVVRQRVTRDLLGRRGRQVNPAWANRRLLLRGRERLSEAALARMWNGRVDHDPSGQILSAWIAKEELRALCATAARGGHPSEIRTRLWAF